MTRSPETLTIQANLLTLKFIYIAKLKFDRGQITVKEYECYDTILNRSDEMMDAYAPPLHEDVCESCNQTVMKREKQYGNVRFSRTRWLLIILVVRSGCFVMNELSWKYAFSKGDGGERDDHQFIADSSESNKQLCWKQLSMVPILFLSY